MACHSPSFGSYTVAIIPFKTSLFSLDSLHFYLWHLKHLEQEKDALWCGLEILEKARLWYLQRIQENRHRQDHTAPTWTSEVLQAITVVSSMHWLYYSLVSLKHPCSSGKWNVFQTFTSTKMIFLVVKKKQKQKQKT
uniref:Suppressor APC domain containing 1 n=1 Tax=Periophthalmus magnuspinnatus TaxID=409849 RepID=A0A3B4A9D5_9GOBI